MEALLNLYDQCYNFIKSDIGFTFFLGFLAGYVIKTLSYR